MRLSNVASYGILTLGLAALTACGSDSTSPTPKLSPGEAQAVASSLFGEISLALGTPGAAPSRAPLSIAPATTTANGTVTRECTGGGTLNGTYNVTSNLDEAGTGTQHAAATFTAAQCGVSTGTQTIAIDGNLTYSFDAGFTNHELSSNLVWTALGNFSWSGGSCALDYTITLTPQGGVTYGGTVCGVEVHGSVDPHQDV